MFQNLIQNVKKSALLIVPTSRYWKCKLPCTDQLVENLRTEVCWLRRALYRRSSSDLVTANHGARCPAKTHTLLSRNHSWYIQSEKIGFTFLTYEPIIIGLEGRYFFPFFPFWAPPKMIFLFILSTRQFPFSHVQFSSSS